MMAHPCYDLEKFVLFLCACGLRMEKLSIYTRKGTIQIEIDF